MRNKEAVLELLRLQLCVHMCHYTQVFPLTADLQSEGDHAYKSFQNQSRHLGKKNELSCQ